MLEETDWEGAVPEVQKREQRGHPHCLPRAWSSAARPQCFRRKCIRGLCCGKHCSSATGVGAHTSKSSSCRYGGACVQVFQLQVWGHMHPSPPVTDVGVHVSKSSSYRCGGTCIQEPTFPGDGVVVGEDIMFGSPSLHHLGIVYMLHTDQDRAAWIQSGKSLPVTYWGSP